MGEASLLARVTAAAHERHLSQNTLIAYRRIWLKLIAWWVAEGVALETMPSQRVLRRALERGGWSAGTVLTSRTWRLRTVDARHDANRRNMFNCELRDRVERLCQELSDLSQG